MAERIVTVDGAELCVDTFGDPADPSVLLIGGIGASMDYWDADLCRQIAAAGRHVVRYDHRDTGRSSSSPPGKPSYSGEDLTLDAVRVLDALDIARAHVVGVSMGGGIAQELAAHRPDRLASLTLIAASPVGKRDDAGPLPPPEPRLAELFANPIPEPDWDDPDAVIDYLLEDSRPYAGALGFEDERERRLRRTAVARTRDPHAAAINHAVVEGGLPPFRLADIGVPTLVMHGSHDPLFPLPHGEALAAEIPGASFVVLEGMGHEFPPPPTWDVLVPALVRHTDRPDTLT
jgi:pimeloyl-ACP methyl ester carboxylesterase